MVRERLNEIFGKHGVYSPQRVHLGPYCRRGFRLVEAFEHRLCRIMLHKYVVAESTLAFSLCGRAVGTESYQVILPREVVGTLRVKAPTATGAYVGIVSDAAT